MSNRVQIKLPRFRRHLIAVPTLALALFFFIVAGSAGAQTPPAAAPPALPGGGAVAPPALPGGGGAPPTLPGQAAPDSTLPVPNFFQDEPSMTLNTNEAANPKSVTTTAPTFNFEKTPEQLEKERRQEAFNAAIQGILPLKPDEIRQLLEHFDRTQESVELPVYPSPKPEVAVETVSLDPGVKPVVVKVAYGNVTTLNILDITGAPWPIEDISWAGNFEVVEGTDKAGSHIIRITPQSEFANGNMSIRLLTLKTPVILSLETSRDIVHYRFDAIIPDYGPLATTPLIDKGISIEAGDKDMAEMLEGVIPPAAEKLSVSGVDGRTTAYKFKNQTLVRTPLTLLSPSWGSSVSSADGMHVYAIASAPILLMSDKGRMVRAHLASRDNALEDVKHD